MDNERTHTQTTMSKYHEDQTTTSSHNNGRRGVPMTNTSKSKASSSIRARTAAGWSFCFIVGATMMLLTLRSRGGTDYGDPPKVALPAVEVERELSSKAGRELRGYYYGSPSGRSYGYGGRSYSTYGYGKPVDTYNNKDYNYNKRGPSNYYYNKDNKRSPSTYYYKKDDDYKRSPSNYYYSNKDNYKRSPYGSSGRYYNYRKSTKSRSYSSDYRRGYYSPSYYNYRRQPSKPTPGYNKYAYPSKPNPKPSYDKYAGAAPPYMVNSPVYKTTVYEESPPEPAPKPVVNDKGTGIPPYMVDNSPVYKTTVYKEPPKPPPPPPEPVYEVLPPPKKPEEPGVYKNPPPKKVEYDDYDEDYGPKKLVATIGPYPGLDYPEYVDPPKGYVTVTLNTHHDMDIEMDVINVHPLCSSSYHPTDKPNSCGVHIHEGMTCSVADEVLGHHWNKAKLGDANDPWKKVRYDSTADSTSTTELHLQGGNFYDYDMNVGRAVVIHDVEGARIACGVLLPVEADEYIEDPGPMYPVEDKNPYNYYCGDDEVSAKNCGYACPTGEDSECLYGQYCFKNVQCLYDDVHVKPEPPVYDEPPPEEPPVYEDGVITLPRPVSEYPDDPVIGDPYYPDEQPPPIEGRDYDRTDVDGGDGLYPYFPNKDPPPVVDNDYDYDGGGGGGNYCGVNYAMAAATCSRPCPSGLDSECSDYPGGNQKCFGGVHCLGPVGARWCGSSFEAASEYCGTPCPDGTNYECPPYQRCFSHVDSCVEPEDEYPPPPPPQPSYYCGKDWADAMTCYYPSCPNGVDSECPEGLRCIADIHCGDEVIPPPPPPSPIYKYIDDRYECSATREPKYGDYFRIEEIIHDAIRRSTCRSQQKCTGGCSFGREDGPYPLAAKLVRLAFHDSTGHVDGYVNLHDLANNAGLSCAVDILNKLYEKIVLSEDWRLVCVLSKADFFVWSYLAAIRHGVMMEKDDDGHKYVPEMKITWGRISYYPTSDTDIGPHEDHPHLNTLTYGHLLEQYFSEHYGFTKRQIVIIMGAHTMGLARLENTLHRGPWTQNPHVCNEEFYGNIQKFHWRQIRISETTFQWSVCDDDADRAAGDAAGVGGGGGSDNMERGCFGLMLNVDISLYHDIDDWICTGPGTSRATYPNSDKPCIVGEVVAYPDDSPCKWGMQPPYARCFPLRAETSDAVAFYAENRVEWLDAFSEVYYLMLTKRVAEGTKIRELIAPPQLTTAEAAAAAAAVAAAAP